MINAELFAQCAELVDALENARRIIHGGDGTLHIDTAEPVLRRAYALLAQSTTEPPTDEELLRLYGVATPCYHVEEFKRELDFARAVFERWG